jgi:hypothetical protein
MLIKVLGAPTSFTYAGCAIVKAIAERASGPHHQIAAVFLEDLRKAWAELPDREGRRQVIIVSDLPSTPLLDLMRSSRVPAIVFVDGFNEIVDQLVAVRGMCLRPALRHATQVLCAIDQIGEESALRVTKADGGRTLKAFVEALCEFLGVEAASDSVGAIMADLGYAAWDGPTLAGHVESRLPSPISPAPADATDKALLRFVARQYAEIGSGVRVERIAWPTELFFQVEPPRDFLVGPTELVGPRAFSPMVRTSICPRAHGSSRQRSKSRKTSPAITCSSMSRRVWFWPRAKRLCQLRAFSVSNCRSRSLIRSSPSRSGRRSCQGPSRESLACAKWFSGGRPRPSPRTDAVARQHEPSRSVAAFAESIS